VFCISETNVSSHLPRVNKAILPHRIGQNYLRYYNCYDSTAVQNLGLLLFRVRGSHSDTPYSIGLLWTSDRLVAETSTWKHTTFTRHRHPRPGGIRTHNPSKRAPADPHHRSRGHRID